MIIKNGIPAISLILCFDPIPKSNESEIEENLSCSDSENECKTPSPKKKKIKTPPAPKKKMTKSKKIKSYYVCLDRCINELLNIFGIHKF